MWTVFGYLASVLVLIAFYMQSPLRLRIIALCSNLAFIGYAVGLHLIPVLMLHLALLPINAVRLRQILAAGDTPRIHEVT